MPQGRPGLTAKPYQRLRSARAGLGDPGGIRVSGRLELQTETRELLARIEEHIRRRVTGRVQGLQLEVRERGLVLRGRALTYYAKQLAQQAVMEITELPIRANEIEVS
jgi:hypothetical protein